MADSDLLLLPAGGAGNTVVEGALSGCPLPLHEGLAEVPASDLILLDPYCIPNTPDIVPASLSCDHLLASALSSEEPIQTSQTFKALSIHLLLHHLARGLSGTF